MHFRGEKHPDSEKCPVRDAFPWGKSILIRRNVLSGMHFRGKKHPQIIEPADRDAMSVSLPAYDTGWEV